MRWWCHRQGDRAGGIEKGGLEIHTSKRGFHLSLYEIREDRAQNSCEGVIIDNVLQDEDRRTDLLGKIVLQGRKEKLP